MPRKPSPRWHAGNQMWVSDVGEPYVDPKGRTRRRTVSFPGIGRKEDRKAREALRAFLDDQDERDRNSEDPSVATVCEMYLEWVEANRGPGTLDANAYLLGKFMAYVPPGSGVAFGARRSSAMTGQDLERMLAAMEPVNRPSYRAVLHGAVNAAFNWAARPVPERTPLRVVRENPFKGVPKPAVPHADERFADRKELADFLRWAWRHASRRGTRGRPSIENRFDRLACLMLRFLVHTGARPGELCIAGKRFRDRGFVWDYWHPDAGANELGQRVGAIVLPPDVHKTGGKTGRPREIVVPPLLTRALERHRSREWAHPDWVFTHRRGRGAVERGANTAALGEPWTSQGIAIKVKGWRRLAIAAGVKLRDEGPNRFTLYRLRHTRITNMIGRDGGLSYDQAAALTGTSGRMVQTVYGHLTGSRLIDLDAASRRKVRPKPPQ